MIGKIIELPNTGVNMDVSDGFLYIRCVKDVLKYYLATRTEAARAQIFKKDGKARLLLIRGDRIFLRDFCDLYELDCDTLAVVRTWRLGEDLSSDICAVDADEARVYACMRGGDVIVINRADGTVARHKVAETSMWDIAFHGSNLYVGCVSGELIALNREDMSVTRRVQVHRKNIYSLFVHDGLLYSTSQDFCLTATDPATLERIRSVKKAVFNMTTIVGAHRDQLITANGSRGEVTFWRMSDLCKEETIPFPVGGLSGGGISLDGGYLYGSDASGIYALDLRE